MKSMTFLTPFEISWNAGRYLYNVMACHNNKLLLESDCQSILLHVGMIPLLDRPQHSRVIIHI